MRREDFDEFSSMLDGVCSLLSRGAYTPNAQNTALFFRSLARFDIKAVRAGFDAHVSDPKNGRFVPTPADIIGQIEGIAAKDGRPAADEAWALALKCIDEMQTVVWTAEIAHAWGIAKPVLDLGDKVGARMAFKAAYESATEKARSAREHIAWSVSLGFDEKARNAAISEAVALGRVSNALLQAPSGPVAGLLELTQAHGCPPHIKERLEQIKADMFVGYEEESLDVVWRKRTDALKAQQAEAVRRYEEGKGEP
jgi:hypothetical protein